MSSGNVCLTFFILPLYLILLFVRKNHVINYKRHNCVRLPFAHIYQSYPLYLFCRCCRGKKRENNPGILFYIETSSSTEQSRALIKLEILRIRKYFVNKCRKSFISNLYNFRSIKLSESFASILQK